jgi:hypothetical protein
VHTLCGRTVSESPQSGERRPRRSRSCWCSEHTLALLLEGKLALLVVVFVLSSSPVLTTLYAILSVGALCAMYECAGRKCWRGSFTTYLSLVLGHGCGLACLICW